MCTSNNRSITSRAPESIRLLSSKRVIVIVVEDKEHEVAQYQRCFESYVTLAKLTDTNLVVDKI